MNLEIIPVKMSQEEVEEESDLDASIRSLASTHLIEESPKDYDLFGLLNQEEGVDQLDDHIQHDHHDLDEDDHLIDQGQGRGQEEFGQEDDHFQQDLQPDHCDQVGDVTVENGQSTDQIHPVNDLGLDQLDDHCLLYTSPSPRDRG